jgi:hypothetical protein
MNIFQLVFEKFKNVIINRFSFHNIGFLTLLGITEIFLLVMYAIFVKYEDFNSSNIGSGLLDNYYKYYIDISVVYFITIVYGFCWIWISNDISKKIWIFRSILYIFIILYINSMDNGNI